MKKILKMNRILMFPLAISGMLISSCTNSNQNDRNGNVDTVYQPIEKTEVIVKEVEREAEPIPVQTTTLASKQVDKGVLSVTKVKVVGSILNVDLKLNNPEKNAIFINFPADNIYYIDDSNAKKNGVLKDDAGKFMLTPIHSSGEKMYYGGSDKLILMSLKFAAPAPDSKSISLTFGNYGSFDELPVSR